MKRLRVAMVAPPWLPIPPVGYGGIENVLAGLVPELVRLGVDVETFTVGESKKLGATKKHWLYKTGQYDHIHRPLYESLPIVVSQVAFALNKIEQDGGFDLIHDHNGFIGPLAAAFTGPSLPPMLHTLHGPPFSDPSHPKETPDNLLMWRQLAAAKRLYIVSISKALDKLAPRALKSMLLKPVYNGINPGNFPFRKDKSDYFMTLARSHPEKGQGLAAEACAELGYKLKLAGLVADITTPKKVLLELANPLSPYRSLSDFKYFSDKIFPHLEPGQIDYIGDVNGQRKLDLLGHARALLFPIQWDEPFGMAPIEALACGTPVIAMNRGALPEMIEHGVNGFLANNKREFKQYMKRISEIDPAACRKSVEDKFSARHMAEEYLDRYKTVLKLAGKRR